MTADGASLDLSLNAQSIIAFGLFLTFAGFVLLFLAVLSGQYNIYLGTAIQDLLYGMMGLALIFVGIMIVVTKYLVHTLKR